jgi:hypothetical protein
MTEKELPPFERVLIEKNEEGAFVISVESKLCGDVKMTFAEAVSIPVFEALTNALTLQLEIEKLKPAEQKTFPLQVATNVVKGLGWFKALDPKALAAHDFNGIFGAAPPQKGN